MSAAHYLASEGMTSVLSRSESLLTVAEVARELRVSAATVRRWCEEGRLESIRPGRAYRIPRRALEELLDAEGAA